MWETVYKWWGLGPVANLSMIEVFRGKSPQTLSSVGSILWQAVEWTCAYLIWRNRNLKVFTNKCWNGHIALMEIQLKSYEWISARFKKVKIDWLEWLSCSLTYAR
ncbi:uncharacterized protein [Rutidosis leptorrhynchoides]|uniref:uncharacterized protein n=1 Tax=Rutidosis leptorrhynchoides TaxID=125765 RepID=UPI003A9955BB